MRIVFLKSTFLPLDIGDVAVIQHLKQDVEHIRMGFLDLIKKNHGIRISADLLAELAALLIAHIAWWGTDQLGDAVLFHIFGHIDADHGLLAAKY